MKSIKPFLVRAMVLVLLILVAACGSPDEKKMAFFEKGKKLLESGDVVTARLEFKNAIQIDPDFAQAYHYLGKAELRSKNPKAAFGALAKAVKLDPENTAARLDLGRLFLAANALDQAEEQMDVILKNAPDHEDAILLKAGIYLKKKDPKAAFALLEKLEGKPDLPPGFYLVKASGLEMEKKDQEVASVLAQGQAAHPKSMVLILARIRYFGKHGNATAMEAELVKALDMVPGDLNLSMNLAWVYLQTGQQEKADTILDQVIAQNPEDQKRVFAVAALRLKANQIDKSAALIKQGMKVHPEIYQYTALLSEIYLKKKQLEQASQVLEDYIALADKAPEPDRVKARINIAKLDIILRRADQAESQVDQVLEIDPKNIDAQYLKGRLALARRDGDEAVSRFRAVTEAHPDHLAAYIGLANAYALGKNYDLALDILKKALKRAPNSAKILKGMVRVNILKKDTQAAEENLKQLVSLDPYNIGSIAGLGDFYLAQNRYDEAMDQYRLIQQNKKGEALGHLKMAEALSRTDQVDLAIEELKAGAEKTKDSSVFITSLGKLYLRQGQKEEAVEKFKEALAMDPDNKLAWLTLAGIYERDLEYEKAIALYRDFLSRHKDAWLAANNMAFLLGKTRTSKADLDEALKYARMALELNPDSGLVLDTLGWVNYKAGDLEQAEKNIAKAIEKLPDNLEIQYHYAQVCHDLGNTKEAAAHLKQALAGKRNFPWRQQAQALYEKFYQ
ncbi:tetratricopeptide repeat protein [uncultured Desulfobacter sp.]|uniref:tetratricopeptide repeat protein n=1 Tax=uncultured Desulfobacter sp. TaxID=240139 RepID=UPI002AA5E6EC|nr:tetratricopeptide repeat protein [uncultured Desulfobacter sp.]